MPDPQNASHRYTKDLVALVLAFVAGSVDIIGYISFGGMFTAHLTGDTVHMGQALTGRHRGEALTAGAIILTFFGGSMAGRTIIEVGSRRNMRSVAAATLLLEAGLLSSVLVLGNRNQLLLLVLLAAAMGVQTATLTRIGSLTIHTTFVTGMLNKLAQLLSHAAFLTYDVLCGSQTARYSRSWCCGNPALSSRFGSFISWGRSSVRRRERDGKWRRSCCQSVWSRSSFWLI
jgi:uncharacterized membrane protein YoaK (UPF0700 family)